MKKWQKITLIVVIISLIAVLLGLIFTGRYVGWGPFIFLKWNSADTYVLSEETYEFTVEEFTIENEGQTIAGRLYRTSNEDHDGRVLIISQGFTGCMKAGRTSSESFAMSGVNVVTFDFRGGSNYSESEGTTLEMSLTSEISDLHAIIEEVKTWDFVNEDKIILMGYSFGGMVSALTAAERDDIYRLLLIFPAFSTSDDLKAEYPTRADIPEVDNRSGMKVSKPYFDSLYEFDPYEYIASYENEVLIIHGTADELVPYSYSVRANELYKNSELYTIEGGGHGFQGDHEIEYLTKSYEFITR